MNENILIIEDEEALRTMLRDRLRGEGYMVDTAGDGQEGMEKASILPFDLLIIDVMLPIRNGFHDNQVSVSEEDIRQAGLATPILFLTARNETIDKVVGLKLGADDYVTKPFEAAELIARIEALLRRAPTQVGRGVHQFGTLRIDVGRKEITLDGKPVYLSAREFQLLRYLMERSGKSISRTELLRAVWGYDANTYTRTVDVHILSLRKKIEEDPTRPDLIVTVAGVGYKFEGTSMP